MLLLNHDTTCNSVIQDGIALLTDSSSNHFRASEKLNQCGNLVDKSPRLCYLESVMLLSLNYHLLSLLPRL